MYIRRGSCVHFSIIGLLLIVSGDIELNPGPVRFPCGMCGRAVQSNQRGICCDRCDRWFHVRTGCANITGDEYARLSNSSESWVCNICSTLSSEQETREHVIVHCGLCQSIIGENVRRISCSQCTQWFHAN